MEGSLIADYERATELELEKMYKESPTNYNATYAYALKIIETNPKLAFTILNEASKANHIASLEYITNNDLIYNSETFKHSLKKLEKVIDISSYAAYILAEFNYLQAKDHPECLAKVFEYYSKANKLGCLLSNYYLAILYFEGKGIIADKEKSLEYLKIARNNGVTLAYIYLSKYYQEKNIAESYLCLKKACEWGIPVFSLAMDIATKNKDTLIKTEGDLIESQINVIATAYSDAYAKDAMYKRPTAFFTENQSWVIGFQTKFLVKNALYFDYIDFCLSYKEEIYIVFTSLGLWVLSNWVERARKKGKKALVANIEVAIDMVNAKLEKGDDWLKNKKKFYTMNQFAAKDYAKAEKKRRDCVKYSFKNYISPQYFKKEITCHWCKSVQKEIEFKVCSACKKVNYCSRDCQVKDWGEGNHKNECQKLK